MSDAMKYRTREEAEAARQRDPIVLYENRLRERRVIDDSWIESTTEDCKQVVEDAVKFADSSPHPDISELYTDVLAEKYPLQK